MQSDRLRAINGEFDNFSGGTAAAARSQLQELTGLNCGSTAYSCFNSNNSGWIIVKNSQVADRSADHCYMRATGDCFGSQGSLEKGGRAERWIGNWTLTCSG